MGRCGTHNPSAVGARRVGLGLILAVALLGSGGSLPADQLTSQTTWGPPRPLLLEHAEIHAELSRAAAVPGPTGQAARKIDALLRAHFAREERSVFPPLGLLPALSRGETPARMADILPVTDRLREELPRLRTEHRDIARVAEQLKTSAWAQGCPEFAFLADRILRHEWRDEVVTYPAALLVGEYVRARLDSSSSSEP